MNPQRHAVLIASSQFPHEERLQELRCPVNDAEGLGEILRDEEYGGFTNVVVVKNRPHHEALLQVYEVLKSAGKEDMVLIYYSGHGKLDPTGRLHLATEDTRIGALEATSIPVQSIRNYIESLNTRKVVFILDCCFSGAVDKAFMRGGVDDQLQQVSSGQGIYLMTASTAIQVALEKEEDEYGVFTKHIVEGIRSGAADLDGDGRVTMDELYRYVHAKVKDEGFQEPMKWDFNVRGELMIAKTKSIAREERRQALRKKLYSIASKGYLADDLVSVALAVSSVLPADQSPLERRQDALLDEFLNGKLNVGELSHKWVLLQAPSTIGLGPPPIVDNQIDPKPPIVEQKHSESSAKPASKFDLPKIDPNLEKFYTTDRVAPAFVGPSDKRNWKTQPPSSTSPKPGNYLFAGFYCLGILFDSILWLTSPIDIRLPSMLNGVDVANHHNDPAAILWTMLVLTGIVLGIVGSVRKFGWGIALGFVLNPLVWSLFATITSRLGGTFADGLWWMGYLFLVGLIGVLMVRDFASKGGLPKPPTSGTENETGTPPAS